MRALLILFCSGSLLLPAAILPQGQAQDDPAKIRDRTKAWSKRLGPVYYGETAAFWESHTLVAATVEAVRFHDDGVSLFTTDTLAVRVRECVPPRLEGARLSLTFTFHLGSVRDRPQGLKPHFRVGDRILVLLEDGKRRSEDAPFAQYRMMQPGDGDWYSYSKDNDPWAVATLKLCRALSTKDVRERLRRIEAILKEEPDERVPTLQRRELDERMRAVLRRSLEAAATQSKQDLDAANRLLKETGK